ncbi:MAG: response regulator transcription factor [Phenylobacterium sp.]|nr:MAG: response regulator transcription factor [Phenylobacterium sp.]
MRVLVVEDTVDLGEGMVACIERMGHAVDWAQDGGGADRLLRDTAYELLVLDLTLPEMDGVAVLRGLRSRKSTTPVLVVTARSEVEDRVKVLDDGADDYLVKPFDFRELEARVRSLLRRRSGDRTNTLACRGVALDRAARTATIHGAPVGLTRRELALLEVLLANQGKILSKSVIMDQIFDFSAEPSENAIEVIVTRLRPKLAGSGAEIRTHRGLGYQIGAGA